MKKLFTIDILGTEYKVCLSSSKTDKYLKDNDGYSDTINKLIVIDKDNKNLQRKSIEHILAHEIVHSFLHESGLQGQGDSDWAVKEQAIDWIAYMIPKLEKTRTTVIKNFFKK